MPVRARNRKRRDQRAELDAWSTYFECGFDLFDFLPAIGVETRRYGVLDEDVARDAWQRLGASYMSEWPARRMSSEATPHALRVFGEPPGGAG